MVFLASNLFMGQSSEVYPDKGEENLRDAIQAVRTGKAAHVFVNFFNHEDREFLRSLSNDEIWTALKNTPFYACFDNCGKKIGKSETIARAQEIFKKLQEKLVELKYLEESTHPLFTVRGATSFHWHTDGSGSRVPPQAEHREIESLRLTLAFDSKPNHPDTTRFFVPTKKECDEIIRNYHESPEKEKNASLNRDVNAITNIEPDRIKTGEFAQVSFFHTGTIHSGPLDSSEDRILITVFGSNISKTDPIPFPHE